MQVTLVMFREDGVRRDFPVGGSRVMIGRNNECEIRIPLPEVSRRHCEISFKSGGLVLRDLGAANGTLLNDRRIEEEAVKAGDRIKIGPVQFVVQINGAPGVEELQAIRNEVLARQVPRPAGPAVATSRHVYISDEDIDPIAALEQLASSADQTAIHPEEDV